MNYQSIALTQEELRDITGFKLASKQLSALAQMGIPFKVRPDGTPCVLRSTLQPQSSAAEKKLPKPTLNAI